MLGNFVGTQLNGWQPNGTQPDGSQLDGWQFDGTQPDGTQPDGRQSDGSQSDGSQPGSRALERDQHLMNIVAAHRTASELLKRKDNFKTFWELVQQECIALDPSFDLSQKQCQEKYKYAKKGVSSVIAYHKGTVVLLIRCEQKKIVGSGKKPSKELYIALKGSSDKTINPDATLSLGVAKEVRLHGEQVEVVDLSVDKETEEEAQQTKKAREMGVTLTEYQESTPRLAGHHRPVAPFQLLKSRTGPKAQRHAPGAGSLRLASALSATAVVNAAAAEHGAAVNQLTELQKLVNDTFKLLQDSKDPEQTDLLKMRLKNLMANLEALQDEVKTAKDALRRARDGASAEGGGSSEAGFEPEGEHTMKARKRTSAVAAATGSEAGSAGGSAGGSGGGSAAIMIISSASAAIMIISSSPLATSRLLSSSPLATSRLLSSSPLATSRLLSSSPLATSRLLSSSPLAASRLLTRRPMLSSRPVHNHLCRL
ncbi:hypothetical protein QJQ45_020402 [Haematococcus lacustris]|nr:hypothetical protein QJQ45_020402 [Haematococcus lacustris]